MDLISCSNHNDDKEKYVISGATSTFFPKEITGEKKEKKAEKPLNFSFEDRDCPDASHRDCPDASHL